MNTLWRGVEELAKFKDGNNHLEDGVNRKGRDDKGGSRKKGNNTLIR